MDGAQVGVLKEAGEVRLARLLECHNGMTLKPQIKLEVLSHLSDQPLKGKFANEELSALLVAANLPESNGARAKTMGLLHTTGGGCRLSGCPGCKSFAGSLGTRGSRSTGRKE